MAATYEPIATTTLGSAASSIDFTSIASSWTDLRVVLTCIQSSANAARVRFNSDTSTVYSQTALYGNGSSAASARETNSPVIYLTDSGASSTTIPSLYTIDIFNYAGSTYKTCLITAQLDKNGSGTVESNVALWRSTSAITSINLSPSGGDFSIGTTATLYGIKAA